MKHIKRLPSAELNIMLILWQTNQPVTSTYVMNQLEASQNKKLAITSVLTLLSRLNEKGFVHIEKNGKSNVYTPLISEETYSRLESQTILERFYGNSLTSLVSSLVRSDDITKEDLDELRSYLNELHKED